MKEFLKEYLDIYAVRPAKFTKQHIGFTAIMIVVNTIVSILVSYLTFWLIGCFGNSKKRHVIDDEKKNE